MHNFPEKHSSYSQLTFVSISVSIPIKELFSKAKAIHRPSVGGGCDSPFFMQRTARASRRAADSFVSDFGAVRQYEEDDNVYQRVIPGIYYPG
jgi:hypothetical protein